MTVFFKNAYFLYKQISYYLPILYGGRVKWEKLNYDYFIKNKVAIKSIGYVNGKIYVLNTGRISIGSNFQANSGKNYNTIGGDTILRLVAYNKKSIITIGNNVGISNSTIVCWEKIEIEDNVMIGGSVKIWDTNFHSLNPVIRSSGMDNDVKTAPIKICSNAFIGSGAIINKGVTIGMNSIIAAGSVVIKDIPANVIAGGNPCVVIKSL